MNMSNACLTCKHRGSVPNSRHSSCKHPQAQAILSRSGDLLVLMNGIVNERRIPYFYSNFKVELRDEAFLEGWASWPINFDPIWLEACTVYEERVE